MASPPPRKTPVQRPYVTWWTKTPHATAFLLSSKILHVFFSDRTECVLSARDDKKRSLAALGDEKRATLREVLRTAPQHPPDPARRRRTLERFDEYS